MSSNKVPSINVDEFIDEEVDEEDLAEEVDSARSQPAVEITDDQIVADLWEVFNSIDKNQDGVITFMELKIMLKRLGQYNSDAEVLSMIKNIAGDNDLVDFSCFLRAFMDPYRDSVLNGSDEEMDRKVFEIFDVNKDGMIEEIKEIIHEYCMGDLAEDFTEDRIVDMLHLLDTNFDGVIDFKENPSEIVLSDRLNTDHHRGRSSRGRRLSVCVVDPSEANKASNHEMLRNIFNIFDRDNDGVIRHAELKLILNDLGYNLSIQEVDEIINNSGANGCITFEEFMDLMMMDEMDEDEDHSQGKILGIDEHIPFILTNEANDSSCENSFVFPADVEDEDISHERFHHHPSLSGHGSNRVIDKSYSKRVLLKKNHQEPPSPPSSIHLTTTSNTTTTTFSHPQTPSHSPTSTMKQKTCFFPDLSPPRNQNNSGSPTTKNNQVVPFDQVFSQQQQQQPPTSPTASTRPRSNSSGSSPSHSPPTRENELYKASFITRLPAISSNEDHQKKKNPNLLDALKKRLSIFGNINNSNNNNNRLEVLNSPNTKLPLLDSINTRARRNSSPVVPLGSNNEKHGKLMPLGASRNRKSSSQNGIDPKKQYSSSLNTSSYFSQRYSSTDYGTLHTKDQLREAFQLFDSNNDGLVSKEEMKNVFSKIGLVTIMSDEELEQLFKIVDSDNDGNINFDEFVELFLL
ncbi:hypothetical protein FDP41_010385 [Naegleria fowleri]|uniref:EF-hand domain-containing protein n=1 Tax=Naegleria fowleri TaxID=5763 RepID=A0A6A5CCI1_NAEFO|nr:uncharacterized protein FDP41_010385 [Naegleria fowleri]KAF0983320.1 hypothetical protein FDP41_010385 [Naegleria fowleri]